MCSAPCQRPGSDGSYCRRSQVCLRTRPQGSGTDRTNRTSKCHPVGSGWTSSCSVRIAREDFQKAACNHHRGVGCTAARSTAHPSGDRKIGRRRLRPSTARYSGTGNAGFLEGYVTAIRRAFASGTHRQNQCANHRFRGCQSSGATANVGQATAWIQGNGVSDRYRGGYR